MGSELTSIYDTNRNEYLNAYISRIKGDMPWTNDRKVSVNKGP